MFPYTLRITGFHNNAVGALICDFELEGERSLLLPHPFEVQIDKFFSDGSTDSDRTEAYYREDDDELDIVRTISVKKEKTLTDVHVTVLEN